MSIKDQIRAEIERRRNEWLAKSRLIKKGRDVAMYAAGKSSAYKEFLSYIDTLPEQPVEGLNEAARHVWESWNGGTMDDVRRDMEALGNVLNAKKEEQL